MTTLVRIAVALIIGLSAASCFATEDKEAGETGTIEVEVVYKDTGEPVDVSFSVEVLPGGTCLLVFDPFRPALRVSRSATASTRCGWA